MAIKFTDNAATTLYVGIGATDTLLQVAPNKGDNFYALTGGSGDYTVITLEDESGNREFIRVDHRPVGSDVLGSVGYPCTRGYWGSTARAWSASTTIVDCRPAAGAFNELVAGVLDEETAFINSILF